MPFRLWSVCGCLRSLVVTALVLGSSLCFVAGLAAQDSAPPAKSNPPASNSVGEEAAPLASSQEAIAARYQRFQDTLQQLADYLRKSDPQRADLLVRAIGKSKEGRVHDQLRALAEILRQDQLGDAIEREEDVIKQMQLVLELLMSEDRKDEIEKEKARIKDLIKDVNNLIAKQTDARAATERGGDQPQLQKQQEKVADGTKKLGDKIDGQDAQKKADRDREKNGKPTDKKGADKNDPNKKPGDGKKPGDDKPSDDKKLDDKNDKPGDSADGKPSDPKEGKPKDGKSGSPKEGKPKDGKPAEDKPGEDKPKDDSPKDGKDPKDQDQSNDKDKPEGAQPKDSKPSDPKGGKPKEGKPKDGKPQDGKPQQGEQNDDPQQDQPQDDSPKDGKQQQQNNDQQEQQPQKTPGRQEIEKAKQEMDRAIEELKKNRRDKASDKQDTALAELQKAKEKLEEILRQLREEEKVMVLAALEARFRDMLLKQEAVNNGTLGVYAVPESQRSDRHRARAVELARNEADISLLAAKALTLLKEEGSSVAFPEAVEQIREDMLAVARRLERADVGEITQNIEQDIVEALREILETLQKELEKMKDEKQKQQQQQQQQQQKKDQELVNKLAELKMLRSLQYRVNRRTKQLGRLVDGEQALDLDVVQQLRSLSERQTKLQRATHDLATGKTD